MTTLCRSPSAWSTRSPTGCIWGTDWPHPNMKKEAPDDGVLVDRIPHIATDAGIAASSSWSTTRCGFTGR